MFQRCGKRSILFEIIQKGLEEILPLLGAAVFLHKGKSLCAGDAGVKKNGKLFTEMKKFLISEFVFHKFQVPFFNS